MFVKIANKKELSETMSPKRAIGVAVLGVLLYHIFAFAYVCYSMTQAAGTFGATLAATDEMSVRFPTQFYLVQRLVLLPFPNRAADEYYEKERETFLEAARNFELHPYWSNSNEATQDMSFREVVTERMRAMHRQFQESGRMDYRIEKDRWAQFEFFRRNNIPHPEIKKIWFSREEVIDDVKSGDAIESMEHWPIFFKAGHLTQRSSLGTFPLSSLEKYHEKKQELIRWINDKWDYRSRDVDRPWQVEGDAMTDALTPSILVQEPMLNKNLSQASFQLGGRVSLGLVEIKVEVIWGRVYIMQMDAMTVFRRNGDIEDYSTFFGAVLHKPGPGSNHTLWIRDEGHIDCVVETAERVAQAAHIDYVRVDIFLDRSDPKGCKVNEISLSSGYHYYGHENYIAQLWAGPLHDKLYKRFNSTTPVYELSA